MNSEKEIIKFVLPERREKEKAVSSRHFWTFLVSDSSLAVYRGDSGFEVLGLGPGIFISHWIRASSAKKKIGKTLSEAIPEKRRCFRFSRSSGSLKLKTTERGTFTTRTVVVLSDKDGSVEIDLSNEDMDALKRACPEIEFISP